MAISSMYGLVEAQCACGKRVLLGLETQLVACCELPDVELRRVATVLTGCSDCVGAVRREWAADANDL